ncbi:MAG: QacE family quaternary ammonium compound efflux SMR transporter [Legionella sp. 40-6]|nr:multidrug efflux SMR transporter [Legionella sp.]OJY21912.1 MAG: QacE family quaternary ammonium compound efflux SMR transporter [Legionella sp. 40-6]
MAWFYLFMAGIMEIIWSYCMKESAGFTRILPTVICITTMVASVVLLALAMKNLPLGTAYTIWTGIGAVGAFLVGLLVLGEPASSLRLFAALLIVTGLVLMKWAS